MFPRVSAVFLFALATLAAASPAPWGVPTTTPPVTTTTAPPTTTTIPASQCNTGPIQCCNTVESASSSGVAGILGLLGIVLQDLNVIIGLNCSPITAIGLGGGANCVQQPVCCENNNFNGLINIGCTPINLSL
ncbi:hypothetical protein EW146_g5632 [Bondarzewia mesenterica]|uniref:Hydrophobin n=1 Tax=Bondarzewia mesenterica TaxID=1095465 RepID=A0A4S4LT12_9AGAM|nr:hypothetical protein EW146_g5632 [Bondarzewia mesenterica]